MEDGVGEGFDGGVEAGWWRRWGLRSRGAGAQHGDFDAVVFLAGDAFVVVEEEEVGVGEFIQCAPDGRRILSGGAAFSRMRHSVRCGRRRRGIAPSNVGAAALAGLGEEGEVEAVVGELGGAEEAGGRAAQEHLRYIHV